MVMKNNIKTFPYAQKAEQMEAWIRKFERELTERKENLDSILETSRTEETFHFRRGIIHLIKELLGEK